MEALLLSTIGLNILYKLPISLPSVSCYKTAHFSYNTASKLIYLVQNRTKFFMHFIIHYAFTSLFFKPCWGYLSLSHKNGCIYKYYTTLLYITPRPGTTIYRSLRDRIVPCGKQTLDRLHSSRFSSHCFNRAVILLITIHRSILIKSSHFVYS